MRTLQDDLFSEIETSILAEQDSTSMDCLAV